MKAEIILFVRMVIVCTMFCTMGVFVSILVSDILVAIVKGRGFQITASMLWAFKKSYIAGPISAFWVLMYIYLYRFFVKDD